MANKASNTLVGQKTSMPHVELLDIDGSGMLKEIAIVKRDDDGSIHYLDIATMPQIDKGRLKKILSSPHADKYPLWDLMSQSTLSNGLNALDFFHNNFVKIKRPIGAKISTGQNSILNVVPATESVIGSEFANPAEVQLDGATKEFK